MKKRSNRTHKLARQVPLDHLRPGSRHAPGPPEPSQRDEVSPPADLDTDAARGKDTRSTAAVGLRRHLEGAEQGPM